MVWSIKRQSDLLSLRELPFAWKIIILRFSSPRAFKHPKDEQNILQRIWWEVASSSLDDMAGWLFPVSRIRAELSFHTIILDFVLFRRHVILCWCTKHENVRTWMRTNFNPSRGIHNLDSLWKEIKSLFSSPSENDVPRVENNPAQQSKSAFPSEQALISSINAMHLNGTNALNPTRTQAN